MDGPVWQFCAGVIFKLLFRRIVRDGHKAAVVGRGIEKVDPVLARPDIREHWAEISAPL